MEVVDDCAVFLKEDWTPLCEALVNIQMEYLKMVQSERAATDFQTNPEKRRKILVMCERILALDKFIAGIQSAGWPTDSWLSPPFDADMHAMMDDMGPNELWYRLRYRDAKELN